jgi:hypothetical protein
MALELMFVVMDRVGKFFAFLSALAGFFYLFLDRLIAGCVLLLIASLLAQLWLLGIAVQADRVQAALQEGKPLPSPIYTERQRSLAKWAMLLVFIFGVILVIGLFASNTYSRSVTVFSARYPFAETGVRLHEGDQIKITVQGQNPIWDCGRTFMTGPDGFEEKFADTVFPEANACALIGSIAGSPPEAYFFVGSSVTLTAPESGMLILGCNDSLDRFADNPTDSALDVRVAVWNWLNSIPLLLGLINMIPLGMAFLPSARRSVFEGLQLYR